MYDYEIVNVALAIDALLVGHLTATGCRHMITHGCLLPDTSTHPQP